MAFARSLRTACSSSYSPLYSATQTSYTGLSYSVISCTASWFRYGAPVHRGCRQCTRSSAHLTCSIEDVEQAVGKLNSSPMVQQSPPLSLLVSGPSGVGKDSLVSQLKVIKPDIHTVVTATTREKREGEVNGKDYHFVSKAQFEEWIEKDEMFEYALVYGDYKGVPKSSVLGPMKEGKDVLLRVDVQGAATLRKLLPRAVSIFIVAGSELELVQRLVDRKTESEDALIKRVRTLKKECKRIQEFEYVVINRAGESHLAAAQMAAIVDAERCKICNQRMQ